MDIELVYIQLFLKRNDAMTSVMTPSPITSSQIDKVADNLRSVLRKHRTELPSDVVQWLLSSNTLNKKFLMLFRDCVKELNNVFIRSVEVDFERTPLKALEVTDQYHTGIGKELLNDYISSGRDSENVDVYFFNVGDRDIPSKGELIKEYTSRGLVPADLHSLAAVNQDYPSFAREYPNWTQWRDAEGKWIFLNFHHEDVSNGSFALVGREEKEFSSRIPGTWWFAGVRK